MSTSGKTVGFGLLVSVFVLKDLIQIGLLQINVPWIVAVGLSWTVLCLCVITTTVWAAGETE
jgi:hypothetical protein